MRKIKRKRKGKSDSDSTSATRHLIQVKSRSSSRFSATRRQHKQHQLSCNPPGPSSALSSSSSCSRHCSRSCLPPRPASRHEQLTSPRNLVEADDKKSEAFVRILRGDGTCRLCKMLFTTDAGLAEVMDADDDPVTMCTECAELYVECLSHHDVHSVID